MFADLFTKIIVFKELPGDWARLHPAKKMNILNRAVIGKMGDRKFIRGQINSELPLI
jgi:hypothetical protein